MSRPHRFAAVLVIRAADSSAAVRALRHAAKILLRSCGVRIIDLRRADD